MFGEGHNCLALLLLRVVLVLIVPQHVGLVGLKLCLVFLLLGFDGGFQLNFSLDFHDQNFRFGVEFALIQNLVLS